MLDRNLRRSFFDYCQGLLTSPPTGTFTSAWNVYQHDKFVMVNHVPVWPYVYMVDRSVEPRGNRVPLVIIEMGGIQKAPFELGNRNGHIFSADINIFGNDSATRDDLATLFRDYFGLTFAIKDFTTAGSPTIDTATLLDEPYLTPISLGEEVGLEGSLWNFSVVTIEAQTTT